MNWQKLLSNRRIRKSTPNDIRNEFESDYGRIIYSPALRRMHDKTQVFPLTTDDNIHSRLTHSNEVMSLGYTFGIKLSQSILIQNKTGKDELELMRILPVLLQNVCLIHDIGNAPFGHFGETIVSDYFKKLNGDPDSRFNKLDERLKRDFFNYDGNAQGLRVLTKLQYLDNPYGLNLTFATLGSYLKYPNYEEINDNIKIDLEKEGKSINNEHIEKSKHGVFYSEEGFFKLIIEECGLECNGRILRHPLCYLMEAADSIAYLCMDMEDGFNKGLFDISYIKEIFSEKESIITDAVVEICDDEFMNPTTKIVTIRIKLIGYLLNLAFENFENNLDLIETGTYNKELIRHDKDKIYKILQKCCVDKIFSSRDINYLESTGYSVFTGLLDFYINFLFHDNPKYVNRAKSLISKSTIDVAIEENIIEVCEGKLQKELDDINKKLIDFKTDNKRVIELQEAQLRLEEKRRKFLSLRETFITFQNNLVSAELSKEEQRELRFIKQEIYKELKPGFEDLNDYFKFRIILDFISGMTDQFALNHYQKLSGQKII